MGSQHWELVCRCYVSNPSKAELILSLLFATNVQQNMKLFVFVCMSPSLSTLDKLTAVISSSSCTGRAHPKHPFQNMVDITISWGISLRKACLVLHFCQSLSPSLTRGYLTAQTELVKDPSLVIIQTV